MTRIMRLIWIILLVQHPHTGLLFCLKWILPSVHLVNGTVERVSLCSDNTNGTLEHRLSTGQGDGRSVCLCDSACNPPEYSEHRVPHTPFISPCYSWHTLIRCECQPQTEDFYSVSPSLVPWFRWEFMKWNRKYKPSLWYDRVMPVRTNKHSLSLLSVTHCSHPY